MSWQATEPLTHENAHGRPENLDPRVNGPFLDEIREDQERAYREARNKKAAKKTTAKKAAAKKTAKKAAQKAKK